MAGVGCTGDGELEAVSAFLFGGGVVDFEWQGPQADPRTSWMQACGFLRGTELFLRFNDQDNQITVVCEVEQCHHSSTFFIGEVLGYHLGLTHVSDNDAIDAFLLKYDADVRTGRKLGMDGPEWGALSTRIDCVHVISAMLRTLQLGWKVRFAEGCDKHTPLSVGNNDQLNSHVVALEATSSQCAKRN